MKVLVTGASGFIGRHVTVALLERGHQVIALSRSWGVQQSQRESLMHVACDIASPEALRILLARHRPEAAVHLAWDTRPGKYWTAQENLDLVGQGSTLVRLLHEAGCRRFVGAGTCAEYDWSESLHDEHATPCRPRTLYGAAKHALYLVAERYAALSGLSFAWLRYNFVYGPGEHAERLVPSTIRTLRAGRDLPCTPGLQVRDFIHVADAARATVAALESAVSGAINVGAGEPTSVRAVVETLSALIGGPGKPLFGERPAADGEPALIAPKLTRLFDEVGWRPRMPLLDGLAQVVLASAPLQAE